MKEGVNLNYKSLPKNAYEAVNLHQPPPDDNCLTQNIKDCLRNYFVGATSNDILIFSLGLIYAGLYVYPQIDRLALAHAQAIGFRQNLKELFPGKVFRFTGAQVYKHMTPWAAPFYEIELHALWPAWQPGNESKEESWYTIDQWAINKNRDHLYADFIHYPGALTRALIYQILSLQCPGMGVRSEDYPSIVGSLVKVTNDGPDSQHTANPFYLIDNELWLRPIPNSCVPFYVGKNKDEIIEIDLTNDLYKVGKGFPISECTNNMYLVTSSEMDVYELTLHGKQFLDSFTRKDIATEVPEWVLTAIPSKWHFLDE